MKKIFTIVLAGILSASAANAQVDLEVTMPYPVYYQSITSGSDLLTDVVVKNVGSTALQQSDIFYYAYSLDNMIQTVKWEGELRDTFFHTGRQLLPGDTMHISRIFKLKFTSAMNGAHYYCLSVIPDQSVTDVNLSNNEGCQTVILTGGTTSVGELDINSVTGVYPNPATAEVNMDMNIVRKGALTVRLLDLTGRVVAQQELNTLNTGKQTVKMPVGNLPQGLYVYQVQMGDETSTGKLVIGK